jgi:hypothetical protein
VNFITAALQAVAEFFGWRRQREANQNSPEMKANAAAGTRAEIKAEATTAVAKDDVDAIRRQLSD